MALSDCPECWNTPCTCGHLTSASDDAHQNLRKYQSWVKESGLFPGSAVGDPDTLNYPIQSLSSETGEVMGVMTKVQRRLGKIVVDTQDLSDHEKSVLIRELGDTLWALTATANQLGVFLSDIASVNYKKLQARMSENTHYSPEVSD
jgi:NTP pyrophosphatase (non-canonical NTP hydrolase)